MTSRDNSEMTSMAEKLAIVETKLEEHCKAQEISDRKNDDYHLRLEGKIDDTKEEITRIPDKIAKLVEGKADKEYVDSVRSDLKELRGWIWCVIAAILSLAAKIIYDAIMK